MHKSRAVSVKKLLLIGTGICLLTFVTCYIVAHRTGNLKYPYYFLSTSIDQAPASCLGSFGLSPVVLIVIPVVAWVRYEQVVEVMGTDSYANKAMLVSALTSAIGGHGVASFQWSNGWQAHLVFAGLFFGGGCVVAGASLVTDHHCPNFGTPTMRALRKLLGVLATGMLLALCVIAGVKIVGVDCKLAADSAKCMTEFKSYQFTNSVLELSVMACLLGNYTTFLPEFTGWKFKLSITREIPPLLSAEDRMLQKTDELETRA